MVKALVVLPEVSGISVVAVVVRTVAAEVTFFRSAVDVASPASLLYVPVSPEADAVVS